MSRPLVLMAGALALAALGASAVPRRPPLLVWNPTASAPIGIWRVSPGRTMRVGDWALLAPEPRLATWLAETGRLPLGAFLIKKVAAGAGQTVCRVGPRVLIDGQTAVLVRARDASGASLPRWEGCRTMGDDELLLLNEHPDSLDGRYFGVTKRAQVLGRASLLWRR